MQFVWVKGHAGHPENERCDQMAVAAALGENLRIESRRVAEKRQYIENITQTLQYITLFGSLFLFWEKCVILLVVRQQRHNNSKGKGSGWQKALKGWLWLPVL